MCTAVLLPFIIRLRTRFSFFLSFWTESEIEQGDDVRVRVHAHVNMNLNVRKEKKNKDNVNGNQRCWSRVVVRTDTKLNKNETKVKNFVRAFTLMRRNSGLKV